MNQKIHYLREGVFNINHLVEKIEEDMKAEKPKLDFEETKAKARAIFIDFKAAIIELIVYSNNYSDNMALTTANTIMNSTERMFLESTTMDAMLNALRTMVIPFVSITDWSSFANNYSSSWDIEEKNKGHFSEEGYNLILSSIKKTVRPIKILDIAPAFTRNYIVDFKKIRRFNEGNNELYICDEDNQFSSRRDDFTRRAVGSFQKMVASNYVFDVVFAEVPYIKHYDMPANGIRPERAKLMKAIHYVREGGLFCVAIPKTRLYRDICNFISRELKEVEVRVDDFQVYIIGKRRFHEESKEIDKGLFNKLRDIIIIDNDLSDYGMNIPLEETVLPMAPLDLKFFRGADLDENELMELFDKSNATHSYIKDSKVLKQSENARHPLLPFNNGQFGLILTSGCLDGVINEPSGHSHVVKGRVLKTHTVERNQEDDDIVETEVFSNKVEINAFLADGTYKRLA